jgi:hypothetical protein
MILAFAAVVLIASTMLLLVLSGERRSRHIRIKRNGKEVRSTYNRRQRDLDQRIYPPRRRSI